MINKISNLKLILGLVLLALVYLAVVFFDSSKSAPLEKQLVTIDTSKVTRISINADDQMVNLTRSNQVWQVDVPSGKQISAVDSKVKGLLEQLMNIRTDRLAAKEKDKWGDYLVDSTGIQIQVYQDDQMTLDMIVGKSGNTHYIRLADEIEVYASDNFRGVNSNINHYRDNTFIKMDTDSIQSIAFNYPGDSSFQLVNTAGTWLIDREITADSTLVEEFTRQLRLKHSDSFAEQDGSSVGSPLAEIVVTTKNQGEVSIRALADAADSVVYQTSSNLEAFFNDPSLGKEYFVGQRQLLVSKTD